jgi:hypothetical protein
VPFHLQRIDPISIRGRDHPTLTVYADAKDETYKLAMGITIFIDPSMFKVPYLLERHRGASSVAAFLLLFSLTLLLFGALSLPIFKPVYIFALETSSIVQGKTPATELRFGVWGLCAAK